MIFLIADYARLPSWNIYEKQFCFDLKSDITM